MYRNRLIIPTVYCVYYNHSVFQDDGEHVDEKGNAEEEATLMSSLVMLQWMLMVVMSALTNDVNMIVSQFGCLALFRVIHILCTHYVQIQKA